MRVARWSLHVRFYAGAGTPTRNVALGIAHFDAAAARLGRCTATEAAAGGDVTQHSRSVRAKGKRRREQANTQTKELKKGKEAREHLLKAHEHEVDFGENGEKNR